MKTTKLTPLENLSRWVHPGRYEDDGRRVEALLAVTSGTTTQTQRTLLTELLVKCRHAARLWWGRGSVHDFAAIMAEVEQRFHRQCMGIDTLQTVVVNLRDCPMGWERMPEFVYIGRAMPRYGLKASEFANEFKGPMAAAAYRQKLRMDPLLRARAREALFQKILVCWCKPKECHGDPLVAIANGNPDWDYPLNEERLEHLLDVGAATAGQERKGRS